MATKSRKKASTKASRKPADTPPPSDDLDELDIDDESDGAADFEPDDDGEDIDIPEPEVVVPTDEHRRDWRDVERYLEKRELRKLVGDELEDIDDLDIDFDDAPHDVKPHQRKR